MIGDIPENWLEAVAEHKRLTELRVQKMMASLEAHGFHCERDYESKLVAIWIWPEDPIQEPPEDAPDPDLMADDTLADCFLTEYLKELKEQNLL